MPYVHPELIISTSSIPQSPHICPHTVDWIRIALLAVGILATIVVVIFITFVARIELKKVIAKSDSDKEAAEGTHLSVEA